MESHQLSISVPGTPANPRVPIPFSAHTRGLSGHLASGRSCSSQGNVSGPAERAKLLREDIAEVVVVADGRKDRGVRCEGDGGQRAAFPFQAVYELGRDMLGIGRASAVAEKKEAAVSGKRAAIVSAITGRTSQQIGTSAVLAAMLS